MSPFEVTTNTYTALGSLQDVYYPTFQKLVGRAPISAAEFARRHEAVFVPQANPGWLQSKLQSDAPVGAGMFNWAVSDLNEKQLMEFVQDFATVQTINP